MQLALMPSADGFAQWRNPSGGRVLRFVFFNRADRRFFDVVRRRKVWLARTEIGHVNAFGFHFFRFGEYSRRRRDLDTVDAVSQLQLKLLRQMAVLRSPVYKQDRIAQTPNGPARRGPYSPRVETAAK